MKNKVIFFSLILFVGILSFQPLKQVLAQNSVDPVNNQCSSGFVLLKIGGTSLKCVNKSSDMYASLIKGGAQVIVTDPCSGKDFSNCTGSCSWGSSGTCITTGTVAPPDIPVISGDTTVTGDDLGDKQCEAIAGSRPVTTKEICNSNEERFPCGDHWICVLTNLNIGGLQKFKLGTKQGQGEITYNPKITIPCNTKIAGGVCPANWKTDIASYIVRLYQFGLMIAGLLALGAIMYGAVLYTLSAGNFTSKEEGKEWMKNAVYGLVLLFGAYLILYTINPNLVKLTSPTITTLDLDKMIPAAVYVPGGTDTGSALNENTGASGIEGCEVSEGGGGGFLSVNVKTDESNLSSDPNAMKCITCLAGYTKKDGKCFPSASGVCASGSVDSDAKCCPTGQKAVSSGNNKTKCVAPCPTGYDYDTAASCTKCAADYVKFNNKCVKPVSSIPCASGYSDGTTCIPADLIPKNNLF